MRMLRDLLQDIANDAHTPHISTVADLVEIDYLGCDELGRTE